MTRRGTHEGNLAGAYRPGTAKVDGQGGAWVVVGSHPARPVGAVNGKQGREHLRTLTPPILIAQYLMALGLARSLGTEDLYLLRMIAGTQITDSVQRDINLTNGAVGIELQLVDVCHAVGAATAKLQKGKVVVVTIIEHAAMTGPKDTALKVGGTDEVLPGCLPGSQGRDRLI